MTTFVRRFSCTTRVAANALRQILVGRADDHALDRRIRRGLLRRGRQRIVRFPLHHRPDRHAERRAARPRAAETARAGPARCRRRSCSRPQPVAERLDDVIGRHRDVRGAAGDHAQHRREHASHRADLHAVRVTRRRHRIVVPEQLVRAVDQVNVHAGSHCNGPGPHRLAVVAGRCPACLAGRRGAPRRFTASEGLPPERPREPSTWAPLRSRGNVAFAFTCAIRYIRNPALPLRLLQTSTGADTR